MVDGFAEYFTQHELSCNWFDIVDPGVLLRLPPQDIGTPERLADRKAVKDAFKAFGSVRNGNDGTTVVFPAASAGKMLYQSGTDIHGIGKDSSVHASTISDVAVYRKTEDARPDSHPENPEDEHTASFIDNKIAHYLGAVNGGVTGK